VDGCDSFAGGDQNLGWGRVVMMAIGGLPFGKLLRVLSARRISPLAGAAGISAFPMRGRLVQRIAQEEDFSNFILMYALGTNTPGQLGSGIASGVFLALLRAG